MLLKDEKGTGWLINMDQVSAFAPTPDMKGTFVLFANGKTLVSPEPINKYFSQYPMPSSLITPGVVDVEAIKNENAQPK
ncbi:MAG: hypothetical protein AB7V39_00455 [Nitrospiraceae bacterium]